MHDINDNEVEENNERELIYNEEDNEVQNMEKLFNDDGTGDHAVYEIEFKIFDKNTKNVNIIPLKITIFVIFHS